VKVARFEVASELLASVLKLPADTRIVDVRCTNVFTDAKGFNVEIYVKSEAFEDVAEGNAIPLKTPQYRHENGQAVFHGWM
jgi:hypothetical protein